MRRKEQVIFWLMTVITLTVGFGLYSKDYEGAFYFTTMLMPVVFGTSYFFNHFLVPRYLLAERYREFALYLVYCIIISIYLEMLVITIAFVVLANFRTEQMPVVADVLLMAMVLYLVVFVHGFILLIQRWRLEKQEKQKLMGPVDSDKPSYVLLRVNRKQHRMDPEEIIYFESLGDFVHVHTSKEVLTTYEKITSLQKKLPDFVRIHRSFLVNSMHIQRFNNEEIFMEKTQLPFGRKFKSEAVALLTNENGATQSSS